MVKKHQILCAIDQLQAKAILEYSSTELSTPPLMSLVRDEDDIEWLSPQTGRDISIVNDEFVRRHPTKKAFFHVGIK